jgi:hypothetical protein
MVGAYSHSISEAATMKKTILRFGLTSGALMSLMMAATVPFADKIGFDKGEVVGYATMVLAFLLVFFGIRFYREDAGNGQITFARAFAVGISIMLITCVFYVVTWEILYFKVMPDFMDKYSAYMVARLRASGASAAAIQTQVEQMNKFKGLYNNPLYNAAVTFLEPLPLGLVITLVSAAVLRRKERPEAAASSLPASS